MHPCRSWSEHGHLHPLLTSWSAKHKARFEAWSEALRITHIFQKLQKKFKKIQLQNLAWRLSLKMMVSKRVSSFSQVPLLSNLRNNFYYFPREASREVANLTGRKNPHTPVYGVKEFVCLYVCYKLWPQLSWDWQNRMSWNFWRHLWKNKFSQKNLFVCKVASRAGAKSQNSNIFRKKSLQLWLPELFL